MFLYTGPPGLSVQLRINPSLKTMIRRPPTIIALEENDVEAHLQRIYIRHTLTVEFEQLHLDDENRDEMTDPSPSSCVSSESDVDLDSTGLSQEGSPCFEPISPRDRSYASTDAIPHTAVTKFCLKSPIPTQQSSLQLTISTGIHSQADRSVDPPRLKVKFALSPQDLELHSGKAPLEGETGMSNPQTPKIETLTPSNSPIPRQIEIVVAKTTDQATQMLYIHPCPLTRHLRRRRFHSCRVVCRQVRPPQASHPGT